jgi:predicted RNA polymerase sigma factor
VGGLTTAEIARAFLVPEATIAQRISRAKQTIKISGIPFQLPPSPSADRLRVVLHVLYLIQRGLHGDVGAELQRGELTAQAIRLTREVRRLLPEDGEVAGLLALMLLTEARRAARATADGSLVPLAEQDRGRWNQSSSRRASHSSPMRCPEPRSGRTSFRRPSPRSTAKRLVQGTPSGRRFSGSTSYSCASRRTP